MYRYPGSVHYWVRFPATSFGLISSLAFIRARCTETLSSSAFPFDHVLH